MILPDYLQAARLCLINKRPYLASIIWSLIPVEKKLEDGLEYMAVDKYGRWYINTDTVSKTPIGEIAISIIHEINHLLRRHHDRMICYRNWTSSLGYSLANIGADLEINDTIKEEAEAFETEKPEKWCYPENFEFKDGLLAEEYCDKLIRRQTEHKQPLPNIYLGGNTPLGGGNCGSCAGDDKKPWEEDAPVGSDGGTSEVPGLTPSELDVLRRQVAKSVQ